MLLLDTTCCRWMEMPDAPLHCLSGHSQLCMFFNGSWWGPSTSLASAHIGFCWVRGNCESSPDFLLVYTAFALKHVTGMRCPVLSGHVTCAVLGRGFKHHCVFSPRPLLQISQMTLTSSLSVIACSVLLVTKHTLLPEGMSSTISSKFGLRCFILILGGPTCHRLDKCKESSLSSSSSPPFPLPPLHAFVRVCVRGVDIDRPFLLSGHITLTL